MLFPALALAAAALSTPAHAAWPLRLGKTEGIGARLVADDLTDFTADDGWSDQVFYDVGTLPVTQNVADIPVRMAASEADCGGHTCTAMLSIPFTVPADMAAEPFEVRIDRYGSEYVHVFVDGEEIGGMSGEEGVLMRATFEAGQLGAGDHSLMLWITGAGNVGDRPAKTFFLDRIVLRTP